MKSTEPAIMVDLIRLLPQLTPAHIELLTKYATTLLALQRGQKVPDE